MITLIKKKFKKFLKKFIHNYIYILVIMSILAIIMSDPVGENTGGQMLFINELLNEKPISESPFKQIFGIIISAGIFLGGLWLKIR